MIDNLEKIKPLLVFENENDFYYLQILQRKKENPELGSNSRVIKSYFISNIEYLENRYTEIKKLCELFNARAMLRLNKRNYEKVAFKTIQNVANSISNREYMFIKKSYDRACENGHNDKDKKWILDINGETTASAIMLAYIDYNCEPISESVNKGKIYRIIPSKNGIHIITKPFNLKKFKIDYPDVEIHKDNPTNLFIP